MSWKKAVYVCACVGIATLCVCGVLSVFQYVETVSHVCILISVVYGSVLYLSQNGRGA